MKTIPQKSRQKGRPRDKQVQTAILKTALDQVLRDGFSAVSIESIAKESGIAKTSIYLRWPNKAAVVMAAFLNEIEPDISFPKTERALDSILRQMQALAKVYRGKFGALCKALLGAAQFDTELSEAFRKNWISPRRQAAKTVIMEAIRNGELHPGVDPEMLIDALYGGIYYRLMIGTGPTSQQFVHDLFDHVMGGSLSTKSTSRR